VAVGFAVLIAVTSMLGSVLLSPLLIRRVGTGRSVDWTRLSEVGQTYGAASAILSTLAISGVVISLLFQARQARAQQIQVLRGYHLELLRETLENPRLYIPCWGWTIDVPTVDGKRQRIFTIMTMNYARMGYEVGVISELSLRVVLADFFNGEIGRKYWERARHDWTLVSTKGRRERRFVRIVENEYTKAILAGPPRIPTAVERDYNQAPNPRRKGGWRTPTGTLLGLTAGILLGTAVRSRQRP
jgi:hypothetical protein